MASRKRRGPRLGAGLFTVVAATALCAGALVIGAPQARAAVPMVTVGPSPAVPADAQVLGPTPGDMALRVAVVFHPRHPQYLEQLAQAVATPTSPWYRHFLVPRQVRAQFGAAPSVLTATRRWLKSQGLRVGAVSGNALFLPARGSVAQVETAFATSLRQVRLSSGKTAHVNAQAPKVPASLEPAVAAVVGLNTTLVIHLGATGTASTTSTSTSVPSTTTTSPGTTTTASPTTGPPSSRGSPVATSPVPTTQGPAKAAPRSPAAPSAPQVATGGPMPCAAARDTPHAYTANQLGYAYQFDTLYRRGDQGQGVTVALFELANYPNADVSAYASCYGIHPDIRRVPVLGGATIGAASGEATADVETVIGMAPRVHLLVYEAPPQTLETSILANYATIVQQDRAQVVSSSYGICEADAAPAGLPQLEAPLFQEMAVQGQSMLAATGDAGSEACLSLMSSYPKAAYDLAVQDPATQPDVTAVGGTQITTFGSPPVQAAWNQSGAHQAGEGYPAPFDGQGGRPAGYPGNRAGNGGISSLWQMPPWQVGFDTSGNSSGTPCGALAGTDCREVPDVSALAAGNPPGFHSNLSGYAIFGSAGFPSLGWQSVGGTSLATPLWAALVALADQQTPAHHLGLLTPSLYAIDRQHPGAFTDVTTGSNNYLAASGTPTNNTCTYGGVANQPCYQATMGYDMATGLGSPVGGVLVNALVALQVHLATSRVKTATLWHHYWMRLVAKGGLPPYTWAVSAGKLPAGLTLNPTTGVLSGRPTKVGTTAFSITVHTAPDLGSDPTSADAVAYHLKVDWPSQLLANQRLAAGQRLEAGHYRLVMQSDGNLVEYDGSRALWSSHTNGHPGAFVIMQGDGNFVVYARGHRPLWSTRTNGHPGAKVVLQSSDANLVVYGPGHVPLWDAGT